MLTETCPRCGSTLDGVETEVVPDISDDVIRTPFECPSCDAPLVMVLEMSVSEGLAAYVEDRKER